MPDTTALEKYYKTLSDRELLNLGAEGGFTAEAQQVFGRELARRNLGSGNVKKYVAASERSELRNEVIERGGGYRSLGLQFFGKSFLNESDRKSNIQVRTKWFTVSGIPLIPIASYRFKAAESAEGSFPMNTERAVINRVPLYWPQVFIALARTASLVVCTGLVIIALSWFLSRGKH